MTAQDWIDEGREIARELRGQNEKAARCMDALTALVQIFLKRAHQIRCDLEEA